MPFQKTWKPKGVCRLSDPFERLEIPPYTYTVRWVDLDWVRATGDMGQHDGTSQTITLWRGMTPVDLAVAFLHECGEAIQWIRCHKHEVTPHEAIEDASVGYATIFRANPDVARWWVGLLEDKEV